MSNIDYQFVLQYKPVIPYTINTLIGKKVVAYKTFYSKHS